MRVLIVEDDDVKAKSIMNVFDESCNDAIIDRAKTIGDSYQCITEFQYDLIVLDILLPMHLNGALYPAGDELLNVIRDSDKCIGSDLIALTAFSDLADKLESHFAESGVVVCEYSDVDEGWKATLKSMIRKSAIKSSRRFVVICALEEERDGFLRTRANLGEIRTLQGLDIRDIEIDGILGVVVLCPRMGLVTTSTITTLAVERFSPELVCMSGICAGIENRCSIGQVLIANPCFEYQVGKFTPTGFESEQYQIDLSESLRQTLSQIASNDAVLATLYTEISQSGIDPINPQLCTFVSGSAVIAAKEKIEEIKTQHRKMAGLDMEAFGLLQAATLSKNSIKTFTAKAVVDMADSSKEDNYHEAGSIVSARFCVEGISALLS